MSRSVFRKSSVIALATVAAGISSLFLVAAPASALQATCGAGTLLPGNICEQTFTANATFTPNSSMTKLEALLVAGGAGGYGAGGGGEVVVHNFTPAVTAPITIVIGQPQQDTTVTSGTAAPIVAASGQLGGTGGGGASGNGNSGYYDPLTNSGGGGGGASFGLDGIATSNNGGAGATAAAAATAASLTGSLFSADTTCYGGGGAVTSSATAIGTASCGGGTSTSDGKNVAPASNQGGGGTVSFAAASYGAAGVVVLRWNAPTVTLTFATAHGSTAAPETVVLGTAPTKPADPTAEGFVFKGWYTDSGLTTPADFTSSLDASTTFYPSFARALPNTGGGLSPWEVPTGAAALALGVALTLVAARRRTKRVQQA